MIRNLCKIEIKVNSCNGGTVLDAGYGSIFWSIKAQNMNDRRHYCHLNKGLT